jgi:rubrerythrin
MEAHLDTNKLFDAIKIVKENERIAMDSYSEAAKKISNPWGKQLFQELSKFEQYHFERLSALEQSLKRKNDFINYVGREFPLPPIFEIKAAQEPNKKSVMDIISDALELEKQAEKSYAELASQVTNQQGHKMFLQLSKEEHAHYLILSDAYWNLTNLGEWRWSRP